MTAGTLGPAHRPAWARRWDPRSRLGRLLRLSRATAAPGLGLWALVVGVVAVDALWLAFLRVAVAPAGFAACAGLVAALLLASAFWGSVRSEPTLRGMALASACLIALTLSAAILHLLAATLSFPLVDPALARIEAAVGFDWTAYLGFLADHPALSRCLALAYHSSGPQVALVVIALATARRLGRLWRFVRLFAGTLLVVIAVSALLPAVGPYAHYAPDRVPAGYLETIGAFWHLEPLERLRSGNLRFLALGDIRALVTFPSFHVCLAILTAWALAPLRLIGPAAIALNAAVIVGTVGAGGHYLPDLAAGALLAGLALIASRPRGPAPAIGRLARGGGIEPPAPAFLPGGKPGPRRRQNRKDGA
ncbi:phosphatase PAP2 family protein [Methylobacterium durans]|uniref:Inositolphosphotransferase Aur1/Ipt1 domain-containing protein n=1 Tax=Methylobacterium durans TaxID=2202825 RepID=A0A2U8WEA3_9HYPH|nr:phosphatase PAP2 family protein [Methylobacterium durans]AWN44477.1 hypothetical protein DK389_10060 [Methylobacterium durans]